VYLNGAIHGMTRAETSAKMDEIVEFSGCARYIDTPVKRYSSGMMVRLGFAVAAHLEPDILIVDEVLAVGDAEFQKKCVGKMQDVAGHGRTVLFVSHNMGAVADLCSRALIVREGSIADEGDTDQMIKRYLSAHADAGTVDLTHWSGARLGDGPLRFTFARTLNSQGQVCSQFAAGEPLRIVMGLDVPESMRKKSCMLAVSIANAQGQRIFHLVSTDPGGLETLNDSPSTVEIEIPSLILNDGQYYITLWAGDGHRFRHDRLEDCLAFRVDSSAQGRSFCLGLVRQVARWRLCDSVMDT
ncbi:MAG: ABC transporter ATP-binding protein, partial [Kiritimatiellae bacterium]|nr:ABC transporter ATP-binding protein [Kiritimatiellia bacterium]